MHGVAVVEISTILVGERQRREINDKHILDLREDIRVNGLIHAISQDTFCTLIAGWCRLQAIKGLTTPYRYGSMQIEPGFIPSVTIKESDPHALFRIELAENLRRRNLSPMDEARAISRLHTTLKATEPTNTPAKTGLVLDSIRGVEPRSFQARNEEVGDSLLLNSFASDPDVARAATKQDAIRIAKKKLEQSFMGGLGALIKPSVSGDMTLLEGSLVDIFPTLPDESFNGIICDPPYGINADEFGEQSSATGHQYIDDEFTATQLAWNILSHGFRVCKPDAHLYLFCDIRLWPHLVGVARGIGWSPFATPLIWYKPGLGHAPQPGYFGRRYEAILFAQKGNRKLSKSAADVFVHPAVKEKIYAAQKPVGLLSDLLALSFFPGESILDPCCGSGSIFKAAREAKIKVTGIEVNPIAIGLSKNAIMEEKK